MILDQLVFGSARLTGGASASTAERLIRLCQAGGIRQFDTAPSYGLGTAESVLGRALDPRAEIATKVGSERPTYPVARSWLRRAKGLLRPGVSPLAVPLSPAMSGDPAHHAFTPEQMARSIERSRRLLRRETLDLVLLHDIVAAQVTPAVIEVLLAARASGIARAVGHATGGVADPALDAMFPADFVVQRSASPADLLGDVGSGGSARLHSIARAAATLAGRDPSFAERLDSVAARVPPDQADATSARVAASYVIVHARRPDSRLIFATTHADRLKAFLRAVAFLDADPVH